MAYMRRNVNLLLMVLLLAVLGALVLLTTLYQQNYKELSIEHDAKVDELRQISTNFTTKLQELNKTTTELRIESTDKEQLNQLYKNLEAERNKLSVELTATKGQLTEAISKLNTKTAELADKTTLATNQANEITELRENINRKNDIIDNLENDNCNLNKQIDPGYNC